MTCPIHPDFSHYPVALFNVAAITRAYTFYSKSTDAARMAHTLTAIGLIVAIPTALTGWWDYSKIQDEKKKALVKTHAILNSIVICLAIYNWWMLRGSVNNTPTISNVVLGLVGLGLMGWSARLGSSVRSIH